MKHFEHLKSDINAKYDHHESIVSLPPRSSDLFPCLRDSKVGGWLRLKSSTSVEQPVHLPLSGAAQSQFWPAGTNKDSSVRQLWFDGRSGTRQPSCRLFPNRAFFQPFPPLCFQEHVHLGKGAHVPPWCICALLHPLSTGSPTPLLKMQPGEAAGGKNGTGNGGCVPENAPENVHLPPPTCSSTISLHFPWKKQ